MSDYGHFTAGGGVGGEKDNSESDFKSRFQNAVRIQQKNEDERLRRLKKDPSRGIGGNSPDNSSPPGHSLKGVWDDVLQASKMSEMDRLDLTKKITITPFLVTDGSGLVRDRIDGFEKLFMQTVSTIEQFNATVAAGYSSLAVGRLSGIMDLSDDTFELGSVITHPLTYHCHHSLTHLPLSSLTHSPTTVITHSLTTIHLN